MRVSRIRMSLVDQFCPHVHDAPVTAASFDPWSRALATADQQGIVAVLRPGETAPGLLFQPGAACMALSLSRKGKLLAWGDENGSVSVFRVDDGSPMFEELREPGGRGRAQRAVAVSPAGDRMAALAMDGTLRVWMLDSGKKKAFNGFGGNSIHFDATGRRLLGLNSAGQVQLLDLSSDSLLPMDRLQMPADRVCFTLDCTSVIATGIGGISLLRVEGGALLGTHATRGGSGILNTVLSPDGKQVAAISERSVHVFSVADLQPLAEQSRRHGAAKPTGAAWWGPSGVQIASADGLVYGKSAGGSPVLSVGGFGTVRLTGHAGRVGVWTDNRFLRHIETGSQPRELHVDRDASYVLSRPEEGPVQIFDLKTAQKIYDGGPDSWHAADVAVGGAVVALMLMSGGLRWVDLARNKAFQLDWPVGMALSHGGTWLGVITPRGAVRILNPRDGQQVVPEPQLAGVPARLLSFVSRRPDLLLLDHDRVLSHFDLSVSVRDDKPVRGRDVIQINGEVDRLWGITGGQYAAVRFPEGATCSVMFIDLVHQRVATEVSGLHPGSWVDAEYGLILEPARGAAILEREMDGTERRVLRSLSDGEWVCFGQRGLLDASEGFSQIMG